MLQQLDNTVYIVPTTNMKYKHKIEKKPKTTKRGKLFFFDVLTNTRD